MKYWDRNEPPSFSVFAAVWVEGVGPFPFVFAPAPPDISEQGPAKMKKKCAKIGKEIMKETVFSKGEA